MLKDESGVVIEPSKNRMINATAVDSSSLNPTSTAGIIQPQDINLDFDHGGETETETGEESRATLMEPCVNCKIFFLILIYLFWAFAVALSISFMTFTTEVDEGDGFRTYLELTPDQAWNVVIAWWLSTFGWGWLVFNEIRIFLISLLAPSQAKTIFDRAQSNKRALTKTFKSHEEPLSCVTCALIPP